tara:strand:+ start:1203 stop:1943 length:741 start_codon:yes stop_codon:yes gene_type:complete
MLAPILAKLADELAGKFHLAKVDTDREQQIAAQYGVRSLPTVKLFKDGEVSDEFIGALPEKAIREFLERHLDRPADETLKQAAELVDQDNRSEAITLLQQALIDDPNYDKLQFKLASYQLDDRDPAGARTTLKTMAQSRRQDADYKALLATIEMNELAGSELDVESLRMEIASAPENYEARRQLSTLLFLEADIDGAMSEALEIVKGGHEKDRDSGREALLQMFEALGNSNEHVVRYRRLLAQALN